MSKKPDDAARVAGLTSILKAANPKKEPDPSPAPPPAAPVVLEPQVAEATPRTKKKRVGKYRDPNYQVTGVYLMKATVKRARRRWEDQNPDKDFSDLVQILLEQWLSSNQSSS